MEARPKEESFSVPSFAAHSTRGIIRHQTSRRWTMFVMVCIALLMLVCGSTILREVLNPREHPGWFMVFWLSGAWFTISALLLALYDLLALRAQNRAARKAMQKHLQDD